MFWRAEDVRLFFSLVEKNIYIMSLYHNLGTLCLLLFPNHLLKFFIVARVPITKEAIENQYLEALEGVGACLFVFKRRMTGKNIVSML